MKALFRSLLVMLFLWMISLLVYYWPMPDEVLQRLPASTWVDEKPLESNEIDQRVRVLQID